MSAHILIVDDEENIRDLLAQFLTNNGYQVTTVASGAEAFKSVALDRPQLIISDLQLADEDGLEMIAQLRKALPETPVILLTGVLFEPAVVRKVLDSKVACYLEKTSTLAQILEAVRRALDSR